MKIIDAHSHIDFLTHNIQPDVVGTICCATEESNWNNLVDIMDADKNVYAAFGVHPWFVSNIKNDFDISLEKLLGTNCKFMVGEIGLDKYKPDMDKQIEIFVKQFDVAVNLQRTVFLHCVGAWDKVLHILKQYNKLKLPIIVAHDFNGSDKILQNLIDNYNIMFSVHRVDKPCEIQRIEQIPSNQILVESDAKDNVLLCDVVNKITQIKQNADMPDIIYNNTQRLITNGQITQD